MLEEGGEWVCARAIAVQRSPLIVRLRRRLSVRPRLLCRGLRLHRPVLRVQCPPPALRSVRVLVVLQSS